MVPNNAKHVASKVFSNRYYDSLFLMSLSNELLKQYCLTDAAVLMGTPANKMLLRQQGLYTDDCTIATSNDLIVSVSCQNPDACSDAIKFAEERLQSGLRRQSSSVAQTTRSLKAAVRATPAANLVLISTPGKYAALETRDALNLGLPVFLFSDNVPLHEERELKQLASRLDLIVMGPDCGTAMINGIALGFANRVKSGPIGIAGASGTGIQEIASLVDRLGSGISHAIGTGGRDLTANIGGLTTTQAIQTLAADDSTELIIVVSKSYDGNVMRQVLQAAIPFGKPLVVCAPGNHSPDGRLGVDSGSVFYTGTLEEAAVKAVGLYERESPAAVRSRLYDEDALENAAHEERSRLQTPQKYFRGLFTGGTFATEAASLLIDSGLDVHSNFSLESVVELENPETSVGHTCLDMGDDMFTVGKPHPILSPNMRKQRMLAEANNPETALICIDLVLGYGTHPNPAEEVAPLVREAKQIAARGKRYLPVIVSICGTDDDPQGLKRQADAIRRSGAVVVFTNASAIRLAIGILTGCVPSPRSTDDVLRPLPSKRPDTQDIRFALPTSLNVINVGLELFADSLRWQGVPTVHVDFQPPAGDEEVQSLLADML